MPREYIVWSLAVLLAAGAPATADAASNRAVVTPAQAERAPARAADIDDDEDLPTLEDYAQYGGPSDVPTTGQTEATPKEDKRGMTAAQYEGPPRRFRPRAGLMALCGPEGAQIVERMMERTERLTRPTEAQRPALEKLKQAAAKAHEAGKAACPTERFASLPLRFADMEKRLTARLEAIRILRPAIEEYYGTLTDEQKARLNLFGAARGKPMRDDSPRRGNGRNERGDGSRGGERDWHPGWRGRL